MSGDVSRRRPAGGCSGYLNGIIAEGYTAQNQLFACRHATIGETFPIVAIV